MQLENGSLILILGIIASCELVVLVQLVTKFDNIICRLAEKYFFLMVTCVPCASVSFIIFRCRLCTCLSMQKFSYTLMSGLFLYGCEYGQLNKVDLEELFALPLVYLGCLCRGRKKNAANFVTFFFNCRKQSPSQGNTTRCEAAKTTYHSE